MKNRYWHYNVYVSETLLGDTFHITVRWYTPFKGWNYFSATELGSVIDLIATLGRDSNYGLLYFQDYFGKNHILNKLWSDDYHSDYFPMMDSWWAEKVEFLLCGVCGT